jgi:hypothetical protein
MSVHCLDFNRNVNKEEAPRFLTNSNDIYSRTMTCDCTLDVPSVAKSDNSRKKVISRLPSCAMENDGNRPAKRPVRDNDNRRHST